MRNLTAFTLCLLLLASCGGDGGSGGDSSGEAGTGGDVRLPPPSEWSILTSYFVSSFDSFETAARRLIERDDRYLLQKRTWYLDENGNDQFDAATETRHSTYPLLSSGVHYAHAAGLTGAGQIIAFTDDGFFPGHEVFAGKSIHLADGLGVAEHGTHVASAAVGNSASMIGVAPGANLAFGSFATFQTRTAAAQMASRLDAVAMNNSWNFADTPVGQESFDRVFSSADSHEYLAALQTYAQRGVVIFAMDNDRSSTRANLMSALPLLNPDLESGWLAVINGTAILAEDDVIAATRTSSGCLEAAAWCLAAEGAWAGATTDTATSYGFSAGTSFSVPMVAGALALLAEAFPDLSPHDLRIRLLASADNEFAGFQADGEVELVSGFTRPISREWGHGFLDVKAALLPIGLTTATMADGSIHDVTEPLAVEGSATGDAVTRSLQGVALSVHDGLGAHFALPAETLIAQRTSRKLSHDLMRNWFGGSAAACCGVTSYFRDTQLVAAEASGTVVSLMLPGESSDNASFGAAYGQTFEADLGAISVGLGVGRDGGALLPQWGADRGTALLVGEVEVSAPLVAGAELALALGLGGSIGGSDGGTLLNSTSARLSAPDVLQRGDRLTVMLGLPVAVARGRTAISLPVQTRSGSITQQPVEIDLAPENRETWLGLEYRYAFGGRSEAVISMAYATNHGNVADRQSTAAFVGFRTRF